MDISQCPAILTDYGTTLGVDHVLQIVLSNILKNKINMQRCQSGRSCSLGTAVYGSVPRVRIPISAPKNSPFVGLFYLPRLGVCFAHNCFQQLFEPVFVASLSASTHAPKYIRFRSYRRIHDLCAKKTVPLWDFLFAEIGRMRCTQLISPIAISIANFQKML